MNEREAKELDDMFREKIIGAQMKYRKKHPDGALLRYVIVRDAAIIINFRGLSEEGCRGETIKASLEKYLDKLNSS